ncbi:MAG: oligosaccharide flippase family protein [Anaerolineales bacterium]|nr:oligosaccharide flippase family protein [Anaerolineales bacterium]MCW5856130.1 oligosaccharide flippase family protein [Anaerolineales bacterium]
MKNMMGQLHKLLSNDVTWSVVSLGIMAVSGLLLVALLRWHSAETLGVFNQVYAVFIILSQIGVGGVQFSTLKHVSHASDDLSACWEITLSALLLVALIMLPVVVALWLLAEPIGAFLNSDAVAVGIRLATPGLLFFGLNKVLINVVNGLDKIKANSVFRALRFILLPLVVFVFVIQDQPADQFAFALTLTEITVFCSLLIFVFGRLLKAQPLRNFRHWLHQHVSFGARGVLSGVLLDLNTRIDVLMLGYFTSDALVGIYSFASTLAEGFAQIPIAVRWSIDPKLGQHFAKSEPTEIEELSRVTRRQLFPWSLAAGLLGMAAFPALSWLVDGNVDTLGWQLFAIMIVAVTISAGYRSFGGILLQGGRPEMYTLVIVALVAGDALMNLGFIPWLGVTGAAIVTATTYLLEALYLRLAAKRLFAIRL